jgi:hypothetical protein
MGARTYWVAPVPPLNFASGTAFTGTSLLDISPGALLTPRQVPALVPELGTTMRVRATGQVTSTSATPTLVLGLYWGGIAGVPLASLAALAVTASFAAWPWILEYEGEFRALGTSGTIQGQGKLEWPSSLTAWTTQPLPATAAARTVTVSTAAAQPVTIGANWSSATGTPSITCDHLSIELLG